MDELDERIKAEQEDTAFHVLKPDSWQSFHIHPSGFEASYLTF
jgi:hypothetical protein